MDGRPEAIPQRRARVVFFHRRPVPHVFSIERVFRLVQDRLPDRFETIMAVSSFPSRGALPRLRGMLEARSRQGDVNHIVGDVHYLALLLSPSRSVLSVHDCEFMERAGRVKRWIYVWLWLRLPVRRSRIIVVPSEAVRDDLRRYVRCDPDKVRIVPDPVDPIFSPTPLVLHRDEPTILHVGTRANKNLQRVIRALEGIPCRLVVLGPLTPAQRRLLASCRVRFDERLDLSAEEVADSYRDADLVVFASTSEGFGLPIVEAQASGRPVVTSDRPPMPEVAGGGAMLVDPYDVSSIREGILRVLHDEPCRDHLIATGLRNVQRFDAAAVASRFADIYDEVLATVPARAR